MQPDDNDIVFDTYSVDFTPFFRSVYEFVTGSEVSTSQFVELVSTVWTWWSVFAFFLSFLFIYGIIYSYLKSNEYSKLMSDKLAREHELWRAQHHQVNKNTRWEEVQRHVNSERPNDWRLAIIEADILLGEALTKQGYAGNSIGEQLKSVSPQQLPSVQEAWDAHLIRNKIAHQGADYVLTQRDAREAIVKFERVFRELGEI